MRNARLGNAQPESRFTSRGRLLGAGTEEQEYGNQGAIDPGEASEARAHQKIARRGSRGYPVQEDKCIKSRSAVTTIRLAERTRAGA